MDGWVGGWVGDVAGEDDDGGRRELRRVSMTRLWFVWSRIPNWVHSSKSDRTCVTRRKVQTLENFIPFEKCKRCTKRKYFVV